MPHMFNELREGFHVQVLEAFQTKDEPPLHMEFGEFGRIKSMEEDGAALVEFDKLGKGNSSRVSSEDFDKMMKTSARAHRSRKKAERPPVPSDHAILSIQTLAGKTRHVVEADMDDSIADVKMLLFEEGGWTEWKLVSGSEVPEDRIKVGELPLQKNDVGEQHGTLTLVNVHGLSPRSEAKLRFAEATARLQKNFDSSKLRLETTVHNPELSYWALPDGSWGPNPCGGSKLKLMYDGREIWSVISSWAMVPVVRVSELGCEPAGVGETGRKHTAKLVGKGLDTVILLETEDLMSRARTSQQIPVPELMLGPPPN